MRIGILITIMNRLGKKGFYHSQEVGLAREFLARGHQVVIYRCVPKKEPMKISYVDPEIEYRQIPVRAFGIHGYLPSNQIDPNLDCLFAFADTQLFLPHIIKFCENNEICFIPYVGIGHSAQRNLKSKLIDRIFSLGTLRYYRKLPMIAKTEKVANEFRSMGVSNISVAPVGLDHDLLKLDFREYDRDELRTKFGISKDDIVLSFVGRMRTEKRPLDCLKLFDDIRMRDPKHKYKLLMVGDGPELEKVETEAKRFGGDVKIIPQIPYESMWEIHYASDFLINLCDREIFGMAVLEGVIYESSVVARHAAGPDTILKDLPGHILCGNDRGIVEWIVHGEPSKAVLRKASDRILKTYIWERCAELTETICAGEEKRDESSICQREDLKSAGAHSA